MARKRRSRIYWRERGGQPRAYGDFRDLGGGREPLIPAGEKLATTDPDVAEKLAAARVTELDAVRRGRALHGRGRSTPLAAYAAEHLTKKARAAKVTRDWIAQHELFLRRAVEYFGADRDLESIGVTDVQDWLAALAATKTKRKAQTPSTGTLRHALNALSNLYRRAQSEGRVPPGYNPVSSLLEKPAGARKEARWLEIHEGALLLEAARTLPPIGGTALDAEAVARLRADAEGGKVSRLALARAYGVSDVTVGRILRGRDARPPVDDSRVAYPLLATFLLTGGRSAEILGLEVEDISLDRKTVTFRPNQWRRLKTLTSARVVPLHPQLEEILRPYIFDLDRPPSRLLFPSYVTGQEAMVTDWRKTLDRVAVRAGWKPGEIRSKMFRHSYCSARLMTLDGGAPISPFVVSRELGHGSGTMVEKVYSHLGTIRHRSETVEYRVEQHAETLGDRLAAVRG